MTFNVNLIGATYTTRIGLHHLRQNPSKKKKSIVFLGSMASQNAIPGAPMYSIAKHGMLGFFRSLYYIGKAEGINMNIICPWFCETGIIAPLTRMALVGLPLASVDHVVAAMIRSAADDDFNGNTISVDAEGLYSIPFGALSHGIEGYYAEFERRAAQPIA